MGKIDLRQAIKVRKMLKGNYRIGILETDETSTPKGSVVLFTVYEHAPNLCTIETPINNEWLKKNIASGNGIRTINTCVHVPVGCIREIII